MTDPATCPQCGHEFTPEPVVSGSGRPSILAVGLCLAAVGAVLATQPDWWFGSVVTRSSRIFPYALMAVGGLTALGGILAPMTLARRVARIGMRVALLMLLWVMAGAVAASKGDVS